MIKKIQRLSYPRPIHALLTKNNGKESIHYDNDEYLVYIDEGFICACVNKNDDNDYFCNLASGIDPINELFKDLGFDKQFENIAQI